MGFSCLLYKSSFEFITTNLTEVDFARFANELELKAGTNAGTNCSTVDIIKHGDQSDSKHMAKKEGKWQTPDCHLEIVDIFQTSQLRRSQFSFELLPFYFSSICQERVAACQQCTHRLCLVNSTSDIHKTAEGSRSTEIDFLFLFFCSFFPRFLTTKHLCIKTAMGAPWSRSHI